MSNDLSVGFIGAGMMASALMDGLIAKGVVSSPESITCSDVWEPALAKAAEKGIQTSSGNTDIVSNAKDIIIIAVKPHIVASACKDIMKVDGNAVVVSIAAGITIAQLEENLPGRRVVRVMPNTPCLVGEAACGFSLGSLATNDDKDLVVKVFGAVGLALEVAENLLNAVTGLSGSGPAYVFQFIEALSDGGVRSGLPRNVATQLAAQMVKGAAEMVLKTGKHPGALKDGVTSPGGTTIAGVEALEKGGLRSTVISAVTAATKRSMQLGGMKSQDIADKYGL